MVLQFRQTWALVRKDLLLLFSRKSAWSTILRAFWIPVIIAAYLTIIFRAYWPSAIYGIGSPSPVRSLDDALSRARVGSSLVLLNNASSVGNGEIDQVIQNIARPLRAAGRSVTIANSTDQLRSLCRPSLQGVTKCFAAAVFQSSPSTGDVWSYTLRGDASLGLNNLDVNKDTNDGEIRIFPLQHAIDAAITGLNSSDGGSALPSRVDKYLFTSKTNEQWKESIRVTLVKSNINFASVVWIITLIGVTFQLVTLMAKERETEMSDLIETMMPNRRRWEPQAIRLIARHIAFDITYGPSWVVIGLFLKGGYYKETNAGVPIIATILAGMALTSFSILGAAFFKRAQLSSITVVGAAIVLGIVAQITSKSMSTTAVAITGILFTPMAFVNYLIFCARWQQNLVAIEMNKRAPDSPWGVTGGIFWIFFIVQIIVYPILAAFVERFSYGTAASRKNRHIAHRGGLEAPIIVQNATRIYRHSWLWGKVLSLFGKNTEPVIAVKDFTLSAIEGQVIVLVGANGCGKTTILNAIAGLGSMSSGSITVDGSSGIGICPQKNVLWNALTVRQHAKIFNDLKARSSSEVGQDLEQLYTSCGLREKLKTPSRNLSGGQKRKLQLLMMLTGGSNVCCVDEASGGLDPLSRRKIWDVLLASRGSRTVILTTHFLDEAEFLADSMVIMSKGQLRAGGSVSELKMRLGNGYRVQVLRGSARTRSGQPEKFDDIETVATPAQALARIRELEQQGITNYQIAGPTMEEVFMNLAADTDAVYEETELHPSMSRTVESSSGEEKGDFVTQVHSPRDDIVKRRKVGAFRQLVILLHKRWTLFTRNPAPLLQALLFPIIAAGLISILLNGIKNPGCGLSEQFSSQDTETLSSKLTPQLLAGPRDNILDPRNLGLISGLLPAGTFGPSSNSSSLIKSIRLVNSFDEFQQWTQTNFSTIVPGGIYLGDASHPPIFSIRSDRGILSIFSGVLLQNALNVLLTGTRIITRYTVFDLAWPDATTETIQFAFYFGLVMASYPAFFTLYISHEKIRGVKAMEYSNGVRPFPLWSAYSAFDMMNTFISGTIITIIFATARSSAWYGIGYFFVVIILYGIASVLLAYMLARYSKSQFAAFAFCAGGQCIMLLIYLTAYMTIQAQSDPALAPTHVKIAHYAIGFISPISQLIRAMLIGLNLFSVLCVGEPPVKATSPSAFEFYGGPITFLVFQSIFMFLFLIWADHRYSFRGIRRKRSLPERDSELSYRIEDEVREEEARVKDSDDGLKVLHVDKVYRGFGHPPVHAVDNLTFGVQKSEVFALIGPNGAGKSTTISMLRGETTPSGSAGELFVQDVSVLRDRYKARFHLGVCPQFDAIDKMSVREHLAFYARIRGVTNVSETVEHMIRSVGLQPFADRMAEKLSGGNKRKLSLGMALIGNPEVVLIDEASTGLDPLAKRNVWKTLAKFRPGRSILLTTHSMEEADALASRVGVIAKRLLDVGTTDHLRAKHGHGFHLHLVMKSAPRSSPQEMQQVQQWIQYYIPGARMEGIAYHGQMRFIIPAIQPAQNHHGYHSENSIHGHDQYREQERSVVSLFAMLEENKDALGVEFYSVSPSTFDEVFLKIIETHNIGEEEGIKRTSFLRRLFCLGAKKQ